MPNIGALLKQEFVRLSRREVRAQVQTTKRASAQYRRDIAALKRELAMLKRQVAAFERRSFASPTKSGSTDQTIRFVAKGLQAQRNRLGLSAENYGRLLGVSAQSIYNWEQRHTTPRPEQVKAIAALRAVGKREAMARLNQMVTKRAGKSRKR